MNAKSLTVLVLVAGVSIAVAAVALRNSSSSAGENAASGKLLPGLSAPDSGQPSTADRRNAVVSIQIQRAGQSSTLHRVGDTWTLQDKGDYPVQIDQVRKLVNGLGDATLIDPKTSDPAKYAKLGVQDIDAPDSKSTLVTLSDKDGKAIAKVIVGKEAESAGIQPSKQTYVRRAGEAQSWLANLDLGLHENGTDWLAKEIVKVPQDRIRSIEIRQPDGATLLVDRPTKETKDFTLHDVPTGKEPTYPTVANSLASGLEYVNLEDVQPAADVDFTTGAGPIARYTTFDGLVVTVTTKDQDGKSYASFVASYEAPPAAPEPAPEAKEGEAPTPVATAVKSADEVRKEAESLNARLSQWAYVISSYTRTQVGKKMSELVKDPAPPPAIANPNADPSAPEDDGMGGEDNPVVIPSDLPPEIREQIKAHQQSLGNKTVDGPARAKGETPPGDADGEPADGAVTPPVEPESKPPQR